MGPSLPPTATVEATTKFGISEGRQDAMVSDNACIASSANVLYHSLPFPHILEYSNNAATLLGFWVEGQRKVTNHMAKGELRN